MKNFGLFLPVLMLPAFANLVCRADAAPKDIKGNTLAASVIISNAPQFSENGESLLAELKRLFSSDSEGLKFFAGDNDPNADAASALRLEILFQKSESAPMKITIGAAAYPFGAIAEEHIRSPEYSHKFASDSALMAIHLAALCPSAEIERVLATQDRSGCVRLAIGSAEPLPESEILPLAGKIYEAFRSFYNDSASGMMGYVPEKILVKCPIENIAIEFYRYIFPAKELTKDEEKKRAEEMEKIIAVVKPFPSGVFFVSGLDIHSPYTFKMVDESKDEKNLRRELLTGGFVTASLGGIVRTIPIKEQATVPPQAKQPAATEIIIQKTTPDSATFDYVIEGATIFDGTKEGKRFIGDVGIAGERISAVGALSGKPRLNTISGQGLFLMPGFIDIHSHADSNILRAPDAASHIRQGITTVLAGNCSFSPAGIGAFLKEIETTRVAINIAMLIGGAPVRRSVMGERKGQPLYEEVYWEKILTDLAMEEGAFGYSSGLIYRISEQCYMWELAEISKQLKPYGGFYASHVRGESEEVLDAIREAIHIGEIAQVPVQISHMKVLSKVNWGKMNRYLEIMRQARERGLDVTGDQYPWRASGPAGHYRLYTLLVREGIKRASPEVVFLKDMPGKYQKYSGHLLSELLEGENMTPEELIEDLNLTDKSNLFAAYLCISEDDMILAMKDDNVMVCTDGGVVSESTILNDKEEMATEHPRKYRTYPEFFAKYVRDKNVCTWELGVYKSTGLPAWRLNLADRGVIKAGAYADLVLLNPEKLDPAADFRDQTPPPAGIHYVFVNGKPAYENGKLTGVLSGKPLYAAGRKKP
ncbi:MAG: D-aminoacylase [candidate division BRC1 bacterium ADurb.Bin183]|nr:MAG: D-aminoacylase [candidate division BRC1 bacterium ADurb.Bin183]